VIFLPHGIVGTWLAWRARRAADASAAADPVAGPRATEVRGA
jgi:branched-chain amino acid transport system permease protein